MLLDMQVSLERRSLWGLMKDTFSWYASLLSSSESSFRIGFLLGEQRGLKGSIGHGRCPRLFESIRYLLEPILGGSHTGISSCRSELSIDDLVLFLNGKKEASSSRIMSRGSLHGCYSAGFNVWSRKLAELVLKKLHWSVIFKCLVFSTNNDKIDRTGDL